MFAMVVRLLLRRISRKNETESKAQEISYWARKAVSHKSSSVQTHYHNITGKELS